MMKRLTAVLLLLTSWMTYSMESEEITKPEIAVECNITGNEAELHELPALIQEKIIQYTLPEMTTLHQCKVIDSHTYFSDCSNTLQFSPKGDTLLKASTIVKLLEIKSGITIPPNIDPHKNDVGCLSAILNPAGDKIAIWNTKYDDRHEVEIWDIKPPYQWYNDHDHHYIRQCEEEYCQIISVKFDSTGKKVLVASHASQGENAVKIWDIEHHTCLFEIRDTSWTYSISFDPSEQKVLVASTDGVFIWNALTNELIRNLEGHTKHVVSALYNSAGNKIVTASEDGTAKIWEEATGKCLFTLEDHTGPVTTALFNPAGTQVATGSTDGTVNVWEVATGKLLYTLPLIDHKETHKVLVTFNPGGNLILTASTSNNCIIPREEIGNGVNIWDAVTGKHYYNIKGIDRSDVASAAFNSTGNKLAVGFTNGKIGLYDVIPELLSQVTQVKQAIVVRAILTVMLNNDQNKQSDLKFDFNNVPDLWKAYESLPEPLKELFDSYTIKPSAQE